MGLVDLLVPFLNAREPVWWGMGTLAFGLVLVVTGTSLLRRRLAYGVASQRRPGSG